MADPQNIKKVLGEVMKAKEIPTEERAEEYKKLGKRLAKKNLNFGKRKYILREILIKYAGWSNLKEDEVREKEEVSEGLFTESCDDTTSEEEEEVLNTLIDKMESDSLAYIEGITLSEEEFNTLPNNAKKALIDGAMKLKDMEKKTSKFTHKKREGRSKKTACGSATENYDMWMFKKQTANQNPTWFTHTLTNEAGVKDMWYFEWNTDWEHFEINWEKSKSTLPKGQLSFNTLLTVNENHKKALVKFQPMTFGECFKKKKGEKEGEQDYKALSKVSFQLPKFQNPEAVWKSMKEYQEREKIKKEKEKTEKKKTEKKKTEKKTEKKK
jgi:hypothetical protein